MTEDKKKQIVSGRGIPVRGNEIDTDRIIPARFMKVVSFEGLGEAAFYDERFNDDRSSKSHPFNSDEYAGASILIVNKNFGCGSSREHAPQALMRWGIDAVIGESFAEIFAGNCGAMGIPAVTAPEESIEKLMAEIEAHPETELKLDIESETVSFRGFDIPVTISAESRSALLSGKWDSTASLLESKDEIIKKAGELPYLNF